MQGARARKARGHVRCEGTQDTRARKARNLAHSTFKGPRKKLG